MGPFRSCLGKYLVDRKMTQVMLASKLGISAPYFSLILSGKFHNHPKELLVNNIIKALHLDTEETKNLKRAAELSRRLILIPSNAPARSFVIAHELLECIKKNETKKLEKISKILVAN